MLYIPVFTYAEAGQALNCLHPLGYLSFPSPPTLFIFLTSCLAHPPLQVAYPLWVMRSLFVLSAPRKKKNHHHGPFMLLVLHPRWPTSDPYGSTG